MNLLLGIVGDRVNGSKYKVDGIVYLDLYNECVNTVDIEDFFISDLEIAGIDKEYIAYSLDLNSNKDFIYSNNGTSRILSLGERQIEFNFIVPVFNSNDLSKILNYSSYSKVLNLYLILLDAPDTIISIDLETFKVSLAILNHTVYGDKAYKKLENTFGYALHSEIGEAVWKELCKIFGIELANGVCNVNNCCFIDARICHTAILDDDVKYCNVYGDYKSSAEIVINPRIEKLDLLGVSYKNDVKLYVSNDIGLYVLRDTLYNCGYKGIKSDDTVLMDLKHLADEIRRFTGVNVEFY